MPTPFEWIIDADDLAPAQFSDLLDELTGLMAEIDTELSPTGERTMELRITTLSYNSPARIGLLAQPRRNQQDNTSSIVRECARGLVLVERGRGRPAAFNDDALEHLRNVGNHTGNGVRTVRMITTLVQIEPVVTRQSSANVERLLPHGYSTGSVEGRLEGLNIHGQPTFIVYDAVSGRAVRCYFPEDQIGAVKDAVGRKVIVSGNLRRDPGGRPQQVRPVEFFRPIDEPPATPVRDPAGAYQGLGDTQQYLRWLRGD